MFRKNLEGGEAALRGSADHAPKHFGEGARMLRAKDLRAAAGLDYESHIVAVTRKAGGSFGTPQDLADTSVPNVAPQIVSNAHGALIASWLTFNDDRLEINVAVGKIGGTFGPAHVVASEPGTGDASISSPVAAVGDDGTIAVSWAVVPASGKYTVAKTVTGTVAGSFGTAQAVSEIARPYTNGGLRPAIDENGRVVIAWTHDVEDGSDRCDIQFATRLPRHAAFEGPQTMANPDSRCMILADLAVDGHGNTLAAWSSIDSATGMGRVDTATSATGATGFGSPTTLSDPTENSGDPDIADSKNGDLAVVWQTGNFDTGQFDIQESHRTTGGFTAPAALTTIGEDLFNARAVIGDDGDLTVTWINATTGNFVLQLAHQAKGHAVTAPDTMIAPGHNSFGSAVLAGPSSAGTVLFNESSSDTDWIASRTFK